MEYTRVHSSWAELIGEREREREAVIGRGFLALLGNRIVPSVNLSSFVTKRISGKRRSVRIVADQLLEIVE